MALSPQQQQRLLTLADNLGLTPEMIAEDHQLLRKLGTGETRKDLHKLVKKVDPNRAKMSMRDVDHDDKLEAFRAEIDDKLDLKGAKAAKQKQDEQRAKLSDRYDEKQIEGIEAVATQYGLSDLDAAAVLYAHSNPASDPTLGPPPVGERPGATWEFPTVKGRDGKELDFKSFAADPRTHSMNAAYNIISEFKNKSLSPGFRR